MAKSKIIKDFVNGEVSLEVTLGRALVIASDLKNKKIAEWLAKELYGYETKDELPSYRIHEGLLRLSYVGGTIKSTNQPISKYDIDERARDHIVFRCIQGIKFIETTINDKAELSVNLNQFAPFVINKRGVDIIDLNMKLSLTSFHVVLDSVKKIVLEFLIKADQEFGNLDELDIESDEKKSKQFNKEAVMIVENLIYIGNNNTIEDANISGNDINVGTKYAKRKKDK